VKSLFKVQYTVLNIYIYSHTPVFTRDMFCDDSGMIVSSRINVFKFGCSLYMECSNCEDKI